MAKAAKKKSASKKSARVTAKPKASARSAKTATKKPAAKKISSPKIDPLNRKAYRAVTPMLAVSDVRRALDFYTSAFGFTVRQTMDTPQGVVHAELQRAAGEGNRAGHAERTIETVVFHPVEDQVSATEDGIAGISIRPRKRERAIADFQCAAARDGSREGLRQRRSGILEERAIIDDVLGA